MPGLFGALNAGGSARRPSALALNAPAQRRHRPDYWLLLLSLLLLGVGIVVVFAINPGTAGGGSERSYVSKQFIAAALGLIAFGLCAWLPTTALRHSRNTLVVLAIISALLVQIFGEEVNGAFRWIQFGGFSFQSVELIKFALIFYLADLFAERARTGQMGDWHKTTKPLIIILAATLVVIAGLQSDLGSAGVMIAIMLLMGFSAGLQMRKFMMLAAILLAGLVMAISTSSYRRERLATYLHPASDCQGAGYQSCQALIAIGSGGLWGLGLGKSVQAQGYLPEAANDSIFAIVAEKFGFIGVSLLLFIYGALLFRIKRVIERTKDNFNRLVATGVLAWLGVQAVINIGSMLGLMPLKGITLPFISYGGTSLIFVMAATGVVFSISRYTAYQALGTKTQAKGATSYESDIMRRRNRRPYYAAVSRR